MGSSGYGGYTVVYGGAGGSVGVSGGIWMGAVWNLWDL